MFLKINFINLYTNIASSPLSTVQDFCISPCAKQSDIINIISVNHVEGRYPLYYITTTAGAVILIIIIMNVY